MIILKSNVCGCQLKSLSIWFVSSSTLIGSQALTKRLRLHFTSARVPLVNSRYEGSHLSMGVLRNIVIGVIAISFLTFVALFGQLPALRKTPIGWLQRVLCLHIPNSLRAADRVATGGKITLRSKRLGHYLFYEKNPVVLVWRSR